MFGGRCLSFVGKARGRAMVMPGGGDVTSDRMGDVTLDGRAV